MQPRTVRVDAEYTPRDWQRKAHLGMRGKRSALLICSRQIGKTVASIAELITRTIKGPENTANAYLAPTQTQARKIAWQELKRQIAPGMAFCDVSETQLRIVFPGNRIIYVLGAEAADNLRGLSIRTMVVDERDSISDEFWRTVCLPMFNEYAEQSFILSIGTLSGGSSTLWQLYLDNRDDPDWYCAVVPAETSGCFTPEWLAHQRKMLGESAYLRELQCDPTAPTENAVIGEEMAECAREGRIERLPYRPGVEVWTSFDIGIRDFTAVWGFMLYGRNIEWLFYREFSEISTIEVMSRLQAEFPRVKWGEAILPHDAKAREKSTGFSVVDAFWERWSGPVHCFHSAPNPIATVQAARLNIPRSYFDAANCEKGILRLKSASYVVDQKTSTVTDRVKHDDNSHCFDSFRYAAWRIESTHSSMATNSMGMIHRPKVAGSLG